MNLGAAAAKRILVAHFFRGITSHVSAAAFHVVFRRLDILAKDPAKLIRRVHITLAGHVFALVRCIHSHEI